jgi:hypothetical protein
MRWWLLGTVACGRGRAPEDFHPCDPKGHTRHLVLPEESVVVDPDEAYDIVQRAYPPHLLEPILEVLQLERRLLDDLEALAQLDAQSPECRGARDRELWPCLGLEPVPGRFGVRVERDGRELALVQIVGPLLEGGPSVVMVGARMDHGCDISIWGSDALSAELVGYGGAAVRLGRAPDFTGWLDEGRAAEVVTLYQALLADLARAHASVPPSRVSGAEARALWDSLFTPLPDTMWPRFEHDQIELAGALFPHGPVVSLGARRGRVWALLSSDSALDPRSERLVAP